MTKKKAPLDVRIERCKRFLDNLQASTSPFKYPVIEHIGKRLEELEHEKQSKREDN